MITKMLVACADIAKKRNVTIGTFGHAGDGNLHPTIIADKNDHDEMTRVHAAVDDIFAAALSFGGTVSGEHGIGMAKMKYLKNELGQNGLGLMKSIKEALDPYNIMNPGKMIPVQEV
jgi:glycolate oxidase